MKKFLPFFYTFSGFIVYMFIQGCGTSTDVTISSIEVTQAVQDSANTVPLVAHRATAFRVTINTNGVDNVGPINGSLHVIVDGNELTSSGGLAPLNPNMVARAVPDRDDQDHTLNFELPPNLPIPVSSNVVVWAEISCPMDADVNNNTLSSNVLQFGNVVNPKIVYVLIDYLPNGSGPPDPSPLRPGAGDAMLEGVWPVRSNDPELYSPSIIPSIPYSSDLRLRGVLDSSDVTELGQQLLNIRDINVALRFGFPQDRNVFVYGWLNMPNFGNSQRLLGLRMGIAALGTNTPASYQKTFAHEAGHWFGRRDLSGTTSNAGWDVWGRLNYNPTANQVVGRVKPSGFQEVMNSGCCTQRRWIDIRKYEETYRFLTRNLAPGVANARTQSKTNSEETNVMKEWVIIRGQLDLQKEEVIRWSKVFRNGLKGMIAADTSSEWYLEVKSSENQVKTYPVDLYQRYIPDVDPETGIMDFESRVAFPKSGFFSTVKLLNKEDGKVYGVWDAGQPPQIDFVNPEGAKGSDVIEWSVKDEDTSKEELRYSVFINDDEQEDWMPLAIYINENYLDLKNMDLKDRQNVRIKVQVSDGLNQAFTSDLPIR